MSTVTAERIRHTTIESIDPLTEDDISDKAKQGWRYIEARQYRTRKGSRCWKTLFKPVVTPEHTTPDRAVTMMDVIGSQESR